MGFSFSLRLHLLEKTETANHSPLEYCRAETSAHIIESLVALTCRPFGRTRGDRHSNFALTYQRWDARIEYARRLTENLPSKEATAHPRTT